MNIRTATPQDKSDILGLLDEFSRFLKSTDTPSQVGPAMFDEVISRKDTLIFVCEDEGKLLGLATLYLLPNIRHGQKLGHVEDFFVSSAARGKGVGTQIFEALKDYCRKNGVTVIKLASGNELLGAHKFYEKNGGKTTERFFRFDIK